jgi:hypothetical protein
MAGKEQVDRLREFCENLAQNDKIAAHTALPQILRLLGNVITSQQSRIQELEAEHHQISRRDEIAHETLLKELHNIDNLAETHSRIVLIISAALLAFASTQLADLTIVAFVALFGIFVSVEWLLKIIRHRKVFRSTHDKLTRLERQLGIDAVRPLPQPHKRLFSLDGFTLLLWLSIVIIIFWMLFFGIKICTSEVNCEALIRWDTYSREAPSLSETQAPVQESSDSPDAGVETSVVAPSIDANAGYELGEDK